MAVFRSGSTKSKSLVPSTATTPPANRPPSANRPAPVQQPEPRRPKRSGDRVVGAKSIRNKELPAFSRQLSAMLLAGMPLIQTLDALEDQTSDKNFKVVVLGLKNYLQSGASFSEALNHYPTIFDTLYINTSILHECNCF